MSVAIATMGKFIPFWSIKTGPIHQREDDIIKPKIIVKSMEILSETKSDVDISIISVKQYTDEK
jgi:hypothetical protein